MNGAIAKLDGAAEAAQEPQRFPREVAISVAEEMRLALTNRFLVDGGPADAFEQIKIVGSTRRGKSTVKDLELLFIPTRVFTTDLDSLFSETLKVSGMNLCLDAMVKEGRIVKRPKCDGTFTWGEDIRLAVHVCTGLPVDFFACTRETWWNQLVCRTGGKISNTEIAVAAQERGLKWNPFGVGFTNVRTGKLARTVRSEEDVFEIAGVPYLPPHLRP